MGSASKQPERVRVVVRSGAHVDEAYLDAGYVSKSEALVVTPKIARDLVAEHDYLIVTED